MNPLNNGNPLPAASIPIKPVTVKKFVPLVVSTKSSDLKIQAKLYDVFYFYYIYS